RRGPDRRDPATKTPEYNSPYARTRCIHVLWHAAQFAKAFPIDIGYDDRFRRVTTAKPACASSFDVSVTSRWNGLPARPPQRRPARMCARTYSKLEADMKLSMLLWLMSVLPQPLADQTCLATTVYLEARSQSTVGQLAVAEVAMRRRERGQWGGTVCDV